MIGNEKHNGIFRHWKVIVSKGNLSPLLDIGKITGIGFFCIHRRSLFHSAVELLLFIYGHVYAGLSNTNLNDLFLAIFLCVR